jgi:transcriptional regulator with XRE-family HTH domain
MSDQGDTIARNVARLRSERGLTIGELARRADISKQTLSVLERGAANPTVGTLISIADALGTTLRALIAESGSPVVVRPVAAATWEPGVGGSTRLLDQIYGYGYVRTSIVRLSATARTPSEVLYRGSLHHVFVIEGDVEVGQADRPISLSEGDFARFPADVEHVINSISQRATLHVVTTFPQLSQMPPVPRMR